MMQRGELSEHLGQEATPKATNAFGFLSVRVVGFLDLFLSIFRCPSPVAL